MPSKTDGIRFDDLCPFSILIKRYDIVSTKFARPHLGNIFEHTVQYQRLQPKKKVTIPLVKSVPRDQANDILLPGIYRRPPTARRQQQEQLLLTRARTGKAAVRSGRLQRQCPLACQVASPASDHRSANRLRSESYWPEETG